jgi:hypothetical protein
MTVEHAQHSTAPPPAQGGRGKMKQANGIQAGEPGHDRPGLPWNLSEALGAERFNIRVKRGDAAVGWRRDPGRVIVEKRP